MEGCHHSASRYIVCLMGEDSFDGVLDRLKVIKNSSAQLKAARDAYINSLATLSDDELLQNDQWLPVVQGNFYSWCSYCQAVAERT